MQLLINDNMATPVQFYSNSYLVRDCVHIWCVYYIGTVPTWAK